MDQHDLYLLQVRIAMLITVIGFLVFFFMALGGVKKTRKITRKANKKFKKITAKLNYKQNWFYDI
jgi:hypothetical protein